MDKNLQTLQNRLDEKRKIRKAGEKKVLARYIVAPILIIILGVIFLTFYMNRIF
ncbi:hypothetical protein SFC57_24105 [Niallia circulans]|uniref:hypothetical protein n=1 Tax=Bacillaceae TaxID=186817 RepID=UPI00397CD8E9